MIVLEFIEKRISRQTRFEGRIITVYEDEVILPDGRTTGRELCEHKAAVAVLTVGEDGGFIMVSQYRYAMGEEMLEIPAGILEPGESHREGALRELREETGAVPDELVYLGEIAPSPGFLTEIVHLYMASGLKYESQQLDAGEFLNVVKLSAEQLDKMIAEGKIRDAKTLAAILLSGYRRK